MTTKKPGRATTPPRAKAEISPRTVTVPEEERRFAYEGPDLVTALQVHGAGIEHELVAKQNEFTVGSSPSCDVPLDSPYASSLHCTLERRGQRVRVHAATTKNGTFFAGRRQTGFDIGPGDSFIVGTTHLLALNDDMRLARPVITELVGLDLAPVVDDLLVAAVGGAPILITGPVGAGHGRLVEALHRASLRREMPLVAVSGLSTPDHGRPAAIDRAKRATLALTLTGDKIAPHFVDMIFSPDYQIRLMVVAPTVDVAVASLGVGAVGRMHQVALRPLGERTNDVPTLLDRMFVELRASLRTTELSAKNQRALKTYPWPENLDELREAARKIVTIIAHGSVRAAATPLGIPRSTLQYQIDAIGLHVPLVA